MKILTVEQQTRLEEAVRLYTDALYRFAVLRTGSRAEAEDIVEDVFLRFASQDEVVNIRAYLYRMVLNAVADHFRRRPPQEQLSTQCPADDPAPDERLIAEESRRIAAMVDLLPANQAEVIRLHIFSSLRFTDIADVLECPVTTVKSRFAAGIVQLRNMLKKL